MERSTWVKHVKKSNVDDRPHELKGCQARHYSCTPVVVPPHDLIQRTRLFALAVLGFCRKLPVVPEAQEAARQLRRAATSTRSNYRAARRSRTRAEFLSKLQVAFVEADECVDWLEYLKDGDIKTDDALLQEARELASILAKAVQTTRCKGNSRDNQSNDGPPP